VEYPSKGSRNGKKDTHVARPNYRGLGSVSWADIDSDTIAELVRVVTASSAAIMFGRTSDGGAMSLCILDQSEKIKEYPRTSTEVESLLLWLKDEYFPNVPLTFPVPKG